MNCGRQNHSPRCPHSMNMLIICDKKDFVDVIKVTDHRIA